MGLLVGIGAASDAEIDLELGVLSLELGDQTVEPIAGPGIEVRVQGYDLEVVGVYAGETVNQMGAERQGRLEVIHLELSGT